MFLFSFTTPFILNLVKSVQLSEKPDDKTNLNNLKISIYLDCLIRMLNSPSKFITNSDVPDLAKPILSHIRSFFSEKASEKPLKSKYTRQKALCYYIVLAMLTTSDFTLNVENLFEGIKVSKTEALRIARYVGAAHQAKTDKILLKLRSQLQPSNESNYRKRKRNSI